MNFFHQALDIDETAVLEYTIISGDVQTFSIDPNNGSLSLLKVLDFETIQTHMLQVTVHDTGSIELLNATATVTVNVLVSFVKDMFLSFYFIKKKKNKDNIYIFIFNGLFYLNKKTPKRLTILKFTMFLQS